MPKLVDHEERRAQVVSATCALIAERGIEAATMREIAAVMGLSNGALSHYFDGKNAIVEAAFRHIFAETNRRVEAKVGRATGLAALRIFCLEVMPVEPETLAEARIVLPFWQRALGDAGLAALYEDAMATWRVQVADMLRQARAEHAVATSVADELLIEQLMAMLMGLQILAVLDPGATTATRQLAMLDAWLVGLRPG